MMILAQMIWAENPLALEQAPAPVQDGRKLSEWISLFGSRDFALKEQARSAVRF